jgi:hypothetical protein
VSRSVPCAANGADFWDDRVAGSAVVHAEPRSRDVMKGFCDNKL